MTAPDLDRHGERAARELARRLEPVTTLKDPYAFALRFIQDLVTEHWRHVEPVTGPMPADHRPGGPDAYERGAALARQLLTRKDHP